jgi:hypothetical protein
MQQHVDLCLFGRLQCAFNHSIHTPDRVWLCEVALIKESQVQEKHEYQIF